MKQVFLFLFFSIFLIGYVYCQVDNEPTIAPSDTTIVRDIQDEMADSFGSFSEGLSDDDGSENFTPSLLHSSQDVYQNNTSYNFGIAYFRNRGYDNQYQDICLNGFAMNSMVTGRASFSQWGGLNHVIRWPERVVDMNPATFTFGNVGGATNYDLRASGYRKQIRASYSISNRSYNNRLMLTASSGVSKTGWSVVGSASARFGTDFTYATQSGAMTDYTAFGAFLGVEKKFNSEHALGLTAFVSPSERGMQAGSVQEIYDDDLLGTNYYNPNWGWQDGKKRNARIRTVIEPVVMLTHYYTPKNNKFTITSTLATTFGRNNSTALNWYATDDPRPDYYKYLPSYHKDSINEYNEWRDKWLYDENTRQINWGKMYEANQRQKENLDENGNPSRAQYMVENRIIDHFEMGGASYLIMNLTNHINLSAGVDIRGLKQHNYKTINDLLGGAFWEDVDKFSEGAQPEDWNVEYNDLNKKDVKLYKDSIFGYDYNFLIYNQKAWAMLNFTYPKIDFHVGGQLGACEMWRVGFMKNGRFPDNSEGKSEVKSFFEGGAKAGITYKATGRNYLVLNSQFLNSAPSILNVFLAPRIRNAYISNLKTEKVASVDLSYIMNYPFMKMRTTLYFTQFFDLTKVISFYSGDHTTMVNEAITGMNQRHLGIELGSEIKLSSMFWLIIAGTFGDYRYSNRPTVYTNAENGYDVLGTGEMDKGQTVYWKNYFVAGTPQAAGTLGLKFNHNYWWVNINANYFDKIYCTVNPDRRTPNARGTLDLDIPEDAKLYHQIVDQFPKLNGQFTLDLSVSKSWRIKNYTIGFSINISNITNNTKLATTAWEAYRFDYREFNVDTFANKYYYAFGTTFFAGFNFTFN